MHATMQYTAAALAGCLWDAMYVSNTHTGRLRSGTYTMQIVHIDYTVPQNCIDRGDIHPAAAVVVTNCGWFMCMHS